MKHQEAENKGLSSIEEQAVTDTYRECFNLYHVTDPEELRQICRVLSATATPAQHATINRMISARLTQLRYEADATARGKSVSNSPWPLAMTTLLSATIAGACLYFAIAREPFGILNIIGYVVAALITLLPQSGVKLLVRRLTGKTPAGNPLPPHQKQ